MKKFLLAVLTVVGCAAMAYIESVLRPIYPIKSALKWIVFAGCAVFYLLQSKDRSLFPPLVAQIAAPWLCPVRWPAAYLW